ncbi:MAG: hypothetical protein WCS89_00920 [Candidatus Paceibacterota bacterium]|jgi:hypothetical protein
MTSKKIKTNGGLIKMILLILAILILLAYFGFNIRSIVSSPTFVDNWAFLKSFVIGIWDHYLSGPVMYVWNTFFIPFVWNPIMNNLSKQG